MGKPDIATDDGTWNDARCSKSSDKAAYVCKRPLPQEVHELQHVNLCFQCNSPTSVTDDDFITCLDSALSTATYDITVSSCEFRRPTFMFLSHPPPPHFLSFFLSFFFLSFFFFLCSDPEQLLL